MSRGQHGDQRLLRLQHLDDRNGDGALTSGLYTRNYGPIGTPWVPFDATGLTDLRINRWLRYDYTVSDYVVATPSGAFYYGEGEPPCP